MLGFYNYTVILTYIGMLTGFVGLAQAMQGNLHGALVCLMLAGVCDMFDGKVASTMERTAQEKRFGIQIDSLSDLICFGVLPGVTVCSLSVGSKLLQALCACYVLCALIRLSWFNVDEEERQSQTGDPRVYYLGLPVTTAALFLPTILGFALMRGWPLIPVGAAVLAVMGIAFLTPFKLKKPRLPGKIGMLLCGCGELAILFLGVAR